MSLSPTTTRCQIDKGKTGMVYVDPDHSHFYFILYIFIMYNNLLASVFKSLSQFPYILVIVESTCFYIFWFIYLYSHHLLSNGTYILCLPFLFYFYLCIVVLIIIFNTLKKTKVLKNQNPNIFLLRTKK